MSKILLVEDDPNDVELTLAALEQNGVSNEVVVVRDGEEALNYLFRTGEYAVREPGNPVAVFLDLKLPKVDGLEVLRRTKSEPRLKSIPVVMLTSSREERDMVQSYDIGANAYVVKPVDFEEFFTAVRQVGLFWILVNQPPPGSVGAAY